MNWAMLRVHFPDLIRKEHVCVWENESSDERECLVSFAQQSYMSKKHVTTDTVSPRAIPLWLHVMIRKLQHDKCDFCGDDAPVGSSDIATYFFSFNQHELTIERIREAIRIADICDSELHTEIETELDDIGACRFDWLRHGYLQTITCRDHIHDNERLGSCDWCHTSTRILLCENRFCPKYYGNATEIATEFIQRRRQFRSLVANFEKENKQAIKKICHKLAQIERHIQKADTLISQINMTEL